MKNNVVMWTEADPLERSDLIIALDSATEPIREAMKWFKWEGENLACGPDTMANGMEHWRNLYFYLSGYGDCKFQSSNASDKIHQQPRTVPEHYFSSLNTLRREIIALLDSPDNTVDCLRATLEAVKQATTTAKGS